MTQADVTGSGRNQVDIWHVKLANGETRALSLDELDAGFHDGWITERTMVLAAGSLRWAPLAEVAGLDETPAPVASTPNSIAPLAIDSFGLDASSESPLDLDIEVSVGGESDADLAAFRPRRGRAVLKVMTALVVIGALGLAGFLGRPAVQRALASRAASASAPAVVAAAAAAPAPAPAPARAPVADPAAAVPTVGAASLPNAAPLTDAEKKAAADAEKKAAADAKKAKRGAQKRAK